MKFKVGATATLANIENFGAQVEIIHVPDWKHDVHNYTVKYVGTDEYLEVLPGNLIAPDTEYFYRVATFYDGRYQKTYGPFPKLSTAKGVATRNDRGNFTALVQETRTGWLDWKAVEV